MALAAAAAAGRARRAGNRGGAAWAWDAGAPAAPRVAMAAVSAGANLNAGARQARTLSGARRRKKSPWIARQARDPFVAARESAGFRSRAAFKLLEIDRKLRLLKSAKVVLDLGAAPGGWAQVAAKQCSPGTTIIMCDLLPIDPIPGCVAIQGDFLDPDVRERVRQEAERASGQPYADLVLSDMAPNTLGNPSADHLRQIDLVEAAWETAQAVLRPNAGNFLTKVFTGPEDQAIAREMKQAFREFKRIKPAATRKESREVFFCGKGLVSASE